jgi:hypothetical protein
MALSSMPNQWSKVSHTLRSGKKGPDFRHIHTTLSNRSKILAMPCHGVSRHDWQPKKIIEAFPCPPPVDAVQHLADRCPLH